MKKRILITGANGLLGQKIALKLSSVKTIDFLATSKGPCRIKSINIPYKKMDITNFKETNKIINDFKADVIINCAAQTNVDFCEENKNECWKTNVLAVENISRIAKKNNIHLIHISTDFIFDGNKGPYKENDKALPLNFYGWSKLNSELIVKYFVKSYTIIRTVLVYGITENMSRSNIVLWIKKSLEEKKRINIVTDQIRTPTFSEDLADACIYAAINKVLGIFNVSGKEMMSIYELAQKTAKFWKLDINLINPVNTAFLKAPARRPPVTGFIIEKAEKLLNYKTHTFEESLKLIDLELNKQNML